VLVRGTRLLLVVGKVIAVRCLSSAISLSARLSLYSSAHIPFVTRVLSVNVGLMG
jgi:hypothetical protein